MSIYTIRMWVRFSSYICSISSIQKSTTSTNAFCLTILIGTQTHTLKQQFSTFYYLHTPKQYFTPFVYPQIKRTPHRVPPNSSKQMDLNFTFKVGQKLKFLNINNNFCFSFMKRKREKKACFGLFPYSLLSLRTPGWESLA